jgi:phosphate transport system substrate-binding protein
MFSAIKLRLFTINIILVLLINFMSCKSTNSSVIANTKTDSLHIGVAVTTRHLAKRVIPAFTNKHAKATITSYIHETGNVINDVISGKTTLAITTRNLKVYEQDQSATIMGTPIGIDGLVLAVSKDLPISNLTFEQIVGIWTQKITNWKVLNGPDIPITVIGRTKLYDPIRLFEDFMQLNVKEINDGLFYNQKDTKLWTNNPTKATNTDNEALEILINTPGAITYFPLQILNNYKSSGKPIKDVSFNDIQATYGTISNGTYFIHRRLNIITNGKPQGLANNFIDFLLSEEGQVLVEQAGFLRLQ